MVKQKAIIIDIDGTLTSDPLLIPEEYKYTREGKDTFYKQINYYHPDTMQTNNSIERLIACCGFLALTNSVNTIKPIFVTAREEEPKVKENTEAYIKSLFGEGCGLYMRPFNDFRPNYIIKSEIYEKYLKDDYEVLFVLEDEDNNINMFKSKGLQILKVEDPYSGKNSLLTLAEWHAHCKKKHCQVWEQDEN